MPREMPPKQTLDSLAEKAGVAIALVDRFGIEISVSNDNSICRTLNPEGEMIGQCSVYCGKALDNSRNAGTPISYKCHAGLTCRAEEATVDGHSAALIVGREFSTADDYKRAAERSRTGDWSDIPQSKLFENVLIATSEESVEDVVRRIHRAADDVIDDSGDVDLQIPRFDTNATDPEGDEPLILPEMPQPDPLPSATIDNMRMIERSVDLSQAQAEKAVEQNERVSASPEGDVREWRSLVGSLLDQEFVAACRSVLDFLRRNYGIDSMAWLELKGRDFESVIGTGQLSGRKIRLGLNADDPRIAGAVADMMPVRLSQVGSSGKLGRTLLMFPVPVGNDVTGALAILDEIGDETIERRIARLCHSLASRLEILRLRNKMDRRESISTATRTFSERLKNIGSEDFWNDLILTSAELLQTERASLITINESTGDLGLRAAVGMSVPISEAGEPGERIARIVFEKGRPIVVSDVSLSGLPSVDDERNYRTRSFISTPISLGDRHLAVMSFTDKANGQPFDRSDVKLLRALSPQIAVAVDRAMIREKAGEYEQLSVTDGLTGLLNRRYLEERLTEEVKRSNRYGFPMSFVMLDVDHFKSYNDNFGHPAGDEALRKVAGLLKDTLRAADVAARYGGEEFAILLPQTNEDEALAIAERVRQSVESAAFQHRSVTISVGVASCSAELCSTADVVEAADRALYASKHSGRNRVTTATSLKRESKTVLRK